MLRQGFLSGLRKRGRERIAKQSPDPHPTSRVRVPRTVEKPGSFDAYVQERLHQWKETDHGDTVSFFLKTKKRGAFTCTVPRPVAVLLDTLTDVPHAQCHLLPTSLQRYIELHHDSTRFSDIWTLLIYQQLAKGKVLVSTDGNYKVRCFEAQYGTSFTDSMIQAFIEDGDLPRMRSFFEMLSSAQSAGIAVRYSDASVAMLLEAFAKSSDSVKALLPLFGIAAPQVYGAKNVGSFHTAKRFFELYIEEQLAGSDESKIDAVLEGANAIFYANYGHLHGAEEAYYIVLVKACTSELLFHAVVTRIAKRSRLQARMLLVDLPPRQYSELCKEIAWASCKLGLVLHAKAVLSVEFGVNMDSPKEVRKVPQKVLLPYTCAVLASLPEASVCRKTRICLTHALKSRTLWKGNAVEDDQRLAILITAYFSGSVEEVKHAAGLLKRHLHDDEHSAFVRPLVKLVGALPVVPGIVETGRQYCRALLSTGLAPKPPVVPPQLPDATVSLEAFNRNITPLEVSEADFPQYLEHKTILLGSEPGVYYKILAQGVFLARRTVAGNHMDWNKRRAAGEILQFLVERMLEVRTLLPHNEVSRYTRLASFCFQTQVEDLPGLHTVLESAYILFSQRYLLFLRNGLQRHEDSVQMLLSIALQMITSVYTPLPHKDLLDSTVGTYGILHLSMIALTKSVRSGYLRTSEELFEALRCWTRCVQYGMDVGCIVEALEAQFSPLLRLSLSRSVEAVVLWLDLHYAVWNVATKRIVQELVTHIVDAEEEDVKWKMQETHFLGLVQGASLVRNARLSHEVVRFCCSAEDLSSKVAVQCAVLLSTLPKPAHVAVSEHVVSVFKKTPKLSTLFLLSQNIVSTKQSAGLQISGLLSTLAGKVQKLGFSEIAMFALVLQRLDLKDTALMAQIDEHTIELAERTRVSPECAAPYLLAMAMLKHLPPEDVLQALSDQLNEMATLPSQPAFCAYLMALSEYSKPLPAVVKTDFCATLMKLLRHICDGGTCTLQTAATMLHTASTLPLGRKSALHILGLVCPLLDAAVARVLQDEAGSAASVVLVVHSLHALNATTLTVSPHQLVKLVTSRAAEFSAAQFYVLLLCFCNPEKRDRAPLCEPNHSLIIITHLMRYTYPRIRSELFKSSSGSHLCALFSIKAFSGELRGLVHPILQDVAKMKPSVWLHEQENIADLARIAVALAVEGEVDGGVRVFLTGYIMKHSARAVRLGNIDELLMLLWAVSRDGKEVVKTVLQEVFPMLEKLSAEQVVVLVVCSAIASGDVPSSLLSRLHNATSLFSARPIHKSVLLSALSHANVSIPVSLSTLHHNHTIDILNPRLGSALFKTPVDTTSALQGVWTELLQTLFSKLYGGCAQKVQGWGNKGTQEPGGWMKGKQGPDMHKML